MFMHTAARALSAEVAISARSLGCVSARSREIAISARSLGCVSARSRALSKEVAMMRAPCRRASTIAARSSEEFRKRAPHPHILLGKE